MYCVLGAFKDSISLGIIRSSSCICPPSYDSLEEALSYKLPFTTGHLELIKVKYVHNCSVSK